MSLLRRENFSSGAPLEDKIGYSRAVNIGKMVFVGGTTTTPPDGEAEAARRKKADAKRKAEAKRAAEDAAKKSGNEKK